MLTSCLSGEASCVWLNLLLYGAIRSSQCPSRDRAHKERHHGFRGSRAAITTARAHILLVLFPPANLQGTPGYFEP